MTWEKGRVANSRTLSVVRFVESSCFCSSSYYVCASSFDVSILGRYSVRRFSMIRETERDIRKSESPRTSDTQRSPQASTIPTPVLTFLTLVYTTHRYRIRDAVTRSVVGGIHFADWPRGAKQLAAPFDPDADIFAPSPAVRLFAFKTHCRSTQASCRSCASTI